MTFKFFPQKRKGGFLVLTMILLVCAVVLAISSGIFLRSMSEERESADSENSLKAWGAVTACGEYALRQLASTTGSTGWSYAGNYSLSVGDDSCYIYEVTGSSSGPKLVKASSTVSGFTKKILIQVATNTPRVVVSSWSEVADF